MRVAICLSGELRSIRRCLPAMRINLLDNFDDYDIFYHTWNDDPDLNELSQLVRTGHLKDLMIEPRITLDEKNYHLRKRSEVFIQGFLRQLYCLKQCNDLKKKYELDNAFTYDVVIRLRPDILIDSFEYDVNLFTNLSSSVYIPDHDSWHGYNDRFYYSNSPNMDKLSDRLLQVDDYFNMGGLIHYETFFKYIVDVNGLTVKSMPSRSALLRTSGELNGEVADPLFLNNERRIRLRLNKLH